MITAENLIAMYARNLSMIAGALEGLTHADSLVQPPVAGNCINWVVGHIAAYRNNRVLKILGQPLLVDETTIFARYGRDSAPVTSDAPDVFKLESLLSVIEDAQLRLADGIRSLTPEQAETKHAHGQFDMTAAEWMLFLLRHEAMHLGNLELLRAIALAARS